MLYCIALPARVLFAIKIIILYYYTVGYIMNTTDWFIFIQQEHYSAPKCFAGLLWLLRP